MASNQLGKIDIASIRMRLSHSREPSEYLRTFYKYTEALKARNAQLATHLRQQLEQMRRVGDKEGNK